MKRKFSLMWRVVVVLALVASLGMVFATPTTADPPMDGLHMEIDYPHRVFACEEFDVDVTVCLDEGVRGYCIDDAIVRLTLPEFNPTAPIELLRPTPTDGTAEQWVGDVCPGKCREARFRLACLKPGLVEGILIEVFSAHDPDETPLLSELIDIWQECKLVVKIKDPKPGAIYYPTDVFGVTAEVHNKSDETCDDVNVCLSIAGSAVRVGGNAAYPVGPIPPHEVQVVNWTVHCNGETDVDLTVTATGCGVEACAAMCADTIHIIQGTEDVPTPPACSLTVEILDPLEQCFDEDVCPCDTFPVTVRVTHTGTDGTGNDLNGWVQLKVTDGMADFSTGVGGPKYQDKQFGPVVPGEYEDVLFEPHCDDALLDQGDPCGDFDKVDLAAEAFGCCQGGLCDGSGFTNHSHGSSPWTPGDTATYDDYINQTWIKLNLFLPDPTGAPTVPFKTCHDFCIQDDILVYPVVKNCYTEDWIGGVLTPELTTNGNIVDEIDNTSRVIPDLGPGESTVPDDIPPFHWSCTGSGDVTIKFTATGVTKDPGTGEFTLTICDIDQITFHQKSEASLDVTVEAPECLNKCEEGTVAATVSYDGGEFGACATNVYAELSLTSGCADIWDPDTSTWVTTPVRLDVTDIFCHGDCGVDLEWLVHCDCCNNVTWRVDVSGTDEVCGGNVTDYGTDTTRQVDFDLEITHPQSCDEFCLCKTFCVTAMLTNTDCDDDCEVTGVHIVLPDNMELVGRQSPDITLPEGTMGSGDEQEVSWTVHCTGPGGGDIKVYADVKCGPGCPPARGDNCCDVCKWKRTDTIHIQQYESEVDVRIVSPWDSTHIATSQDFAVTAVIKNGGNGSEATIYEATLLIDPEDSAHVTVEPELPIYIPPGGRDTLTWTVHCDRPADATLNVVVEGRDKICGAFEASTLGCETPEMESSLMGRWWNVLQGYYFSGMYDDTGDVDHPYTTFMGEPEIADPNVEDTPAGMADNPDIYPIPLPWEGNCAIMEYTDPTPVPVSTTFYYLAKVIAPEGSDIIVRHKHGVAVTLIDTMGPYRLYEVKTDNDTTISSGDRFGICAIPSNAGVHIAVTWDINYCPYLPGGWWGWLTGDGGNWDELDWTVTDDVPVPQFCWEGPTVHQYPAAHLEVKIDTAFDEPVVTCEDFPIYATITNTGWADATEVYATISVEPEGSVRVSPDDEDGGYTKHIGTIPGHDSLDNTAEVDWLLHCKVACDSTITITVEGKDEYGLSFTKETTWYEGHDYIEAHVAGEVHGDAYFEGWAEGMIGCGEMCHFDDMVDQGGDGMMLPICGWVRGGFFFDAYVEGFLMGDVYFNGEITEWVRTENPGAHINEQFIEPDSVTVKQITPAQLVVDISYPENGDEFTVCDNFVVTTMITNIGEETADDVGVNIPEDAEFFTVVSEPSGWPKDLAGGESAEAVWLLHCEGEGFSVISAKATWDGELTENEGEAFDIVTVKQGEVPLAQLAVDISYPENGDEFIEGEEFPVTATVYNIGEMDAEDVEATIDTGANASTGDDLMQVLDGIPSGGSKVVSWMVDCDTAGFSIIIVTAVADNANSVVDPVTIKQITPPQPYLTVELSAPEQVFECENFTVTAVVSNIGDADAIGVDADMTASGLVTPLSDDENIGDIDAGDSAVVEFDFHCEGEGGVNISVTADGTDVDEVPTNIAADSIAVQQINVPEPEPYLIVEVSAPEQVYVNEDFTVTAVVSNIGDADATGVDADMTASGLVTPTSDSETIGPIAAGNSAVVEFDFHCEGEGGVNIYVEAEGTNTNIAADSAAVQQKPPIPPTLVSIPDAAAGVGGTVEVPIRITNVIELGGATIWLSYDNDVVIVDSVATGDLGGFFGTPGIDNPAGVTKMNWFSATGKTGDFVFAYVTLQAVGSMGETSDLDLTVQSLVDIYAEPILHGVDDGIFTIVGLMEGDTSLDNCVRVEDAMLIAQYLVGVTLSDDQLTCADTNDIGGVSISDALHIAQWLVDPDMSLGVLPQDLWQSPADDDMLEPDPCIP